jgi:hypothetical protein
VRAIAEPQRLALEEAELVRLLAHGHDREVGLTPGAIRVAQSREWTHEAPR